MKRIFDIIFVISTIFIVWFIVLNSKIILTNYDFNLFWFSFNAPIFLYFLIFFLIYTLTIWIFIRFIFVFWNSKENKLNKKIIELQEKVNENQTNLQTNLIKEIKSSFNTTISNYTQNNNKFFKEKLENIDNDLWKIFAELSYLKKEENIK